MVKCLNEYIINYLHYNLDIYINSKKIFHVNYECKTLIDRYCILKMLTQ